MPLIFPLTFAWMEKYRMLKMNFSTMDREN